LTFGTLNRERRSSTSLGISANLMRCLFRRMANGWRASGFPPASSGCGRSRVPENSWIQRERDGGEIAKVADGTDARWHLSWTGRRTSRETPRRTAACQLQARIEIMSALVRFARIKRARSATTSSTVEKPRLSRERQAAEAKAAELNVRAEPLNGGNSQNGAVSGDEGHPDRSGKDALTKRSEESQI
jgi:hypothetical protein